MQGGLWIFEITGCTAGTPPMHSVALHGYLVKRYTVYSVYLGNQNSD